MTLLSEASFLVTPNGYKEDKLYAAIPTNGNGDMTVTRATTATRVNESGLIELVPYNLLLRSEEFDNISWQKIGAVSVTANQITSPDGNLTADLITSTITPGFGANIIYSSIACTLTSYVFSVYLRAGSTTNVTLYVNRSAGAERVSSNLTLTDTWQRYSILWTGTATASLFFHIAPGGVGIESGSIYAWGAQLNEGTSALTYQKTVDRLDIPRIDYTGGGCPSILLEPQRTNLNLYSNNLENAYWTLYQTTRTINSAVSPDGTTNAIKLTEDSTTNFHSIYLPTSITVTSGQTYSRSVYLKQAGRMWASLVITDNAIVYRAWFDLQNGVVGIVNIGLTAQITNVGNGWYRCQITRTASASTFSSLAIEMAISNGVGSYLGNGTNGIFIYGAQLEQGTYPTSYIPTTTASVTRNADVLSRDNIYTNNLIVGGGGTWFVHLINNTAFTSDANGNLFLDTASGGITNGINIRSIGTVARLYINFYTSGVNTFQYLTTTDTVKLAIKWNGATADVFENGAKVVSATIFATTAMEHLGGNGSDQPKYIKQMALFAKPLTEAQCIALTTL